MQIQKPNRAEHTYVQHLGAPPADVFPLLCPVREAEWVPGWAPRLVLTTSGIAEDRCIFITGPADAESTWIVTRYDPPNAIEFVKHTPGETVGFIGIGLRPHGEAGTAAEVTYAYTSVGPAGDEAVRAFTAEHYLSFMQGWENALSHFLRSGVMLAGAAG